jgi:hypothetical protein
VDYKRIYMDFIADRRLKEAGLAGYTENHHILPKSLGGGNEASNLIRLTAGDHYFAHLLLAKIHGGNQWRAVEALVDMKGSTRSRVVYAKRRWVEIARREGAKVRSEIALRQHQDGRLSALAHSEAAKAKRSASVANLFTGEAGERRIAQMNAGKRTERARKNYSVATAKKWSDDAEVFLASNNFVVSNPMHDPIVVAEVAAAMVEHCAKPEVKAVRSARLLGDRNPMKNVETRKKVSASLIGKFVGAKSAVAKAVICIDTGEVFPTATIAASNVSRSPSDIVKVCRGRLKKCAGYRWAYLDNKETTA